MENSEKEIHEQLRKTKRLSSDIDFYKKTNIAGGYMKTERKIKNCFYKTLFIKTFNHAASILFIPLIISLLVLLGSDRKGKTSQSDIFYTKVSAAPGTIIQAELPDRSTVWLNSGSTLRYPVRFEGDKRKVELTGEGYFAIQTNPDIPFEVMIPSGLRVLAYGTEFNINAYTDDSSEEIVLKEGKVSLMHDNRNIPIVPAEMVSIYKNDFSLKKSKVNVEEKIAWRNGRIIFRNTPLDEVMKKLSRRYNVEITLNMESKVDYRIRATFSNETITQIMDYLKMAAPIVWNISDIEQNNDATFSRQNINVRVK